MSFTASQSTSVVQLSLPAPKIVQRLCRVVLAARAAKNGEPFLDVEMRHFGTSTALTHLCHHMPLNAELYKTFEEFLEASRAFLTNPEAVRRFGTLPMGRLTVLHAQLQGEFARMRRDEMVTKERIEEYISVIDDLREAYLAEGYDVSRSIDVKVYTQACLIVANFEAYDRTLNEK